MSLDYEDFLSILSSNKLNIKSEYNTWKVICEWVSFEKENRHDYLDELIYKCLRFGRLDEHFIETFIFECELFTKLSHAIQSGIKHFIRNVLHNSKQTTIYSFDLSDSSWVVHFSPREIEPSDTEHLLVCVDSKNGSTEFYDSQHNTWNPSPLTLKVTNNQENFKLALLGPKSNILCALGGSDKNSSFPNEMWSRSFDHPSVPWTAYKETIIQSRESFSSVVHNNNDIYVFGGMLKSSTTSSSTQVPLRTCELYDRELNQWTTVAPMNIARCNSSAAVFNGYIYVAGGNTGKKLAVRSVEKYDPHSDSWSEVAPMATSRSDFVLTPFAGRLWAIGGVGEDNQLLLMSAAESYDPLSDSWRAETVRCDKRRWRHAALEFNGELYVVGSKKKKGV